MMKREYMHPSDDTYINNVYFSDARDMKEIPDESVQLVVTSPYISSNHHPVGNDGICPTSIQP